MSHGVPAELRERIDLLYRSESRRVPGHLIRLLGDFDLAEEALQYAFTAATEQWPRDGMPANPRAWLVSTGRFKAINRLRRRARFDAALGELAARLDERAADPAERDDQTLEDDRLRLIFACCHPALSPDAQVAMTLRAVCGLTAEEIARGFLTSPPTVAQRIVRAKAKIRAARIPYAVPPPAELAGRLETVLQADGELILLPDQDRSLWDRIAGGPPCSRGRSPQARSAPMPSRRRSPPPTPRRPPPRPPTGIGSSGCTTCWPARTPRR